MTAEILAQRHELARAVVSDSGNVNRVGRGDAVPQLKIARRGIVEHAKNSVNLGPRVELREAPAHGPMLGGRTRRDKRPATAGVVTIRHLF